MVTNKNPKFYHLLGVLVCNCWGVIYILTTRGPLHHHGRSVVHLKTQRKNTISETVPDSTQRRKPTLHRIIITAMKLTTQISISCLIHNNGHTISMYVAMETRDKMAIGC